MTPVLRWLITLREPGVIYWSDEWLCQKLGLTNTTFQTVHGLDAPGQFSTARDMALLGKALIHDVPEEYAIHKEKEFTFNKIRQPNRNRLLWSSNLNVDGMKTGTTAGAGYNLVASATQGDMRLISVVLGRKPTVSVLMSLRNY